MNSRALKRCEHSMAPGLCVVRDCEHWDGEGSPFAAEVPERSNKARPVKRKVDRRVKSRRVEHVLSLLSCEWERFDPPTSAADRKRDFDILHILVRRGKVSRRGEPWSYEYRLVPAAVKGAA